MVVVLDGDEKGGGDDGESDGATGATSSGLDIREIDGRRSLLVEAKSFTFQPAKEGFTLIESHKGWERELSHSLEQAC